MGLILYLFGEFFSTKLLLVEIANTFYLQKKAPDAKSDSKSYEGGTPLAEVNIVEMDS